MHELISGYFSTHAIRELKLKVLDTFQY